jgi:hypothetical protein
VARVVDPKRTEHLGRVAEAAAVEEFRLHDYQAAAS